eukprot:6195333-Pleurochrysis_carterae.AAC.1
MAMCEIVFGGKCTLPVPTVAAAEPTPSAPGPAAASSRGGGRGESRRWRQAPRGGCTVDSQSAAVAAGGGEEEVDGLAELDELCGSMSEEGESLDALRLYLKQRFGNQAPNVLARLHLWETFGALFSAWRVAWDLDTPAYRAERALEILRAGELHHIQTWVDFCMHFACVEDKKL